MEILLFIKSSDLKHSEGTINGSINIPRKKDSNNFLSFELDGTLPANQCREIFSSNLKEYICDFNTSKLQISGSGDIPYYDQKILMNSQNQNMKLIFPQLKVVPGGQFHIIVSFVGLKILTTTFQFLYLPLI